MTDSKQTLSRSGAQPGLSSVWPTGQLGVPEQLCQGGYACGTALDRDLIPPSIARYVIHGFSQTGQLVMDPDCGAGTVVTEAVRTGRTAIGLATNHRLRRVARTNITSATYSAHPKCSGIIFGGGCVAHGVLRAMGLAGHVDLLVTSVRWHHSDQRISHSPFHRLVKVLRHNVWLLAEDAYVAVTAPSMRVNGVLVGVATKVILAGTMVGLVPVTRYAALTAGLQGSRVVTRAPFLSRLALSQNDNNIPRMLSAHHDVIVFRKARTQVAKYFLPDAATQCYMAESSFIEAA